MNEHQPPSPAEAALIGELRDAIRARDDFIAVASHELRNPMTPILVQVELLRAKAHGEGASPAMQAGLGRLALAVRRYLRRATTLLDVSRVNAGRLRLDPVTLDMAAAVRQVAADHEAAARHAGSPLHLRLPEDGLLGTWDPLAVEQIVENLVGNAVRYGGGQPIEVSVEAEGEDVVLTVRDGGEGIAEADLPKLFGRFEQAVERRNQGGFGLGLWLTQRLVDAMGGSVSVASRVGEGSAFAVRLPRHMAQAEAEA